MNDKQVEQETNMSIAKVIEVIAEGKSIEAAAESAVSEASKTVSGIQAVYLKDIQAIVDGGKIVKYRLSAKITFILA
jgi:flavin-binding protein dodecin